MAVKENKKIKNATPVEYNGIHFRSKSEKSFYVKLVAAGFNPEYETQTFVIWEGFRPSHPWLLDGVPQVLKSGATEKLMDWKYTPDFVIKVGDYTAYLEVKGKGNDIHPYKRKLFLKYIESCNNSIYIEVHTVKGLEKTIKYLTDLKNKQNDKL